MRTLINLSIFLVILALTAVFIPSCGNTQSSSNITLDTDIEKASYAIGVNFHAQLKASYIDIDPQALARGVEDAIAGGDLLMTQNEISQVLQQLSMNAELRYQEEVNNNLLEATEFIIENAKKDGIITLPDSLQYKVLTEGSGDLPKMGDTVRVHYTGSLIDGTVFDSSVERGQPLDLMLGQVIQGWNEALTIMPVGSKWRVFIPPQLAYGPNSQSPIPPNSLLIFEIELLDIVSGFEE